MPRKARPHWSKKRQRWYACIGEIGKDGKAKEVYAPPSIKDERSAWPWMDEEVKRREEASAVVPADGPKSVEWLAEHYLAWAEKRRDEGRLSKGHYTSKGYHLGLLAGVLGTRSASALKAEDLNEFVAAMRAVYAPNYVANICSTASACFNWAVRVGHLTVNPVKGFEPVTVPKSPERFAERAEAAAFLRFWRARRSRASVAGRYDRLTILLERVLIRSGARPGELCALWWSDVVWLGGRTSAGHPFAKAVIPPDRWKSGEKTGKPRTIYLSPVLTRALRREMDRPGRHPVHVFVHGRGRGGIGAGEPWADGSRLSKTVLRVRREAIEEAGRRKEAGEPTRGLELIRDVGHNRLTNYRWRHTAISTLLMMGVDVPTAAELTGTSPEMIYKIYGHLLDTHLQAAAERLAGKR